MFKLFHAYRKSQEIQLNWIRKHPILWITLNVIATVVFVGYIEWADRRDMRKWKLEQEAAESAA